MARGAGFEPARPKRTTGLAGLPTTRLGQPRLLGYFLFGVAFVFFVLFVGWEKFKCCFALFLLGGFGGWG